MKSNPAPLSDPVSRSRQRGPLRVALVITDLDVGGAERALVELATRLDRSLFELRVWSLQSPSAERRRSLVPQLEAAGIPVETLAARGAWDALRVVNTLAARWRLWQPHLVQTFLHHANILGRLAARRARVPHVVSGIRVAERRGRWRLRLDRWTDPLVERHVCVSEAVARYSRETAGLPARKLLVIPNGIDLARFTEVQPVTAAALGLPAGRRWMTYVGRLDAQKGLEWLVAQAPAWLAEHNQHDLLLVGEGPLRGELESAIHRHKLTERVHLVGWQEDVPGILAASDLLVLPSLWEGMPNVVLEAMALARPVLASDVEGVREVLGPDSEPQIAPPKDVQQWRTKLARLLADQALAEQLGARNRERVRQHFTLDAAVQAYAALFQSLAANDRLPASTSDLA